MYRVIKVLNNNGVLVYDMDNKEEVILLGNGAGFGKRVNDRFEAGEGSRFRRYAISDRQGKRPGREVIGGIDAVYLEVAARILERAAERFKNIHRDSLVPLADHIAFAVKRMQDHLDLSNPFTNDICALYPQEFQVALEGKEMILQATGYDISRDEVGYITLHIHSARTDERVDQAMKNAVLIRHSIELIEKGLDIELNPQSLSYNRMMSHIRYLIARTRRGEPVNLDMDEYARTQFPRSYAIAQEICVKLEQELQIPVKKEEIGSLGIHIERVLRG